MTTANENRPNNGIITNEEAHEFLKETRNGLEERLQLLNAERIAIKNNMHQKWAAGMVKLNKNVKSMSVREFNALFKCDLLKSLLQKTENGSPSKKRDRMAVAATPTHQGIKTKEPFTASRTVRKGEALFSMNGSPLEVDANLQDSFIATVTKKKRPGRSLEDPLLNLNLGDGKVISADDPDGVGGLDGDTKSAALNQIKMLQDQMNKMVEMLEK